MRVLAAELGWATEGREVRFERIAHLQEGSGAHASQPLERAGLLVFDIGIEHAHSILRFCKRSIMGF